MTMISLTKNCRSRPTFGDFWDEIEPWNRQSDRTYKLRDTTAILITCIVKIDFFGKFGKFQPNFSKMDDFL